MNYLVHYLCECLIVLFVWSRGESCIWKQAASYSYRIKGHHTNKKHLCVCLLYIRTTQSVSVKDTTNIKAKKSRVFPPVLMSISRRRHIYIVITISHWNPVPVCCVQPNSPVFSSWCNVMYWSFVLWCTVLIKDRCNSGQKCSDHF